MSAHAPTLVVIIALVSPIIAGCMGDEAADRDHVTPAATEYRFASVAPIKTPLEAVAAQSGGRIGSGTAVFLADGEGRVVALDADERKAVWETQVPGRPVALTTMASPEGPRLAVLSASTVLDFTGRHMGVPLPGVDPSVGHPTTAMAILTILDAEDGQRVKERAFRSSVPVAVVAADIEGDGADEIFLAYRPQGGELRVVALDAAFGDADVTGPFVPELFGDPEILWWWYLGGMELHVFALRQEADGDWLLVGTSAALYMVRLSGDHIHLVPENAQDTAVTPTHTVIAGRNGLVALGDDGQIAWEAALPMGMHRVADGRGPTGDVFVAGWIDRDTLEGGIQAFDTEGQPVGPAVDGLRDAAGLRIRALDADGDGSHEWLVEARHADGSGTVRLFDAAMAPRASFDVASLPGPVVVLAGAADTYDLWVPGTGSIAVLSLSAV